MIPAIFDEMKQYVRFDADDAARVQSLAEPAQAMIEPVLDRFYEVLLEHPGARTAITGGLDQINRLKASLSQWLGGVFRGPYNEAYFRSRVRIGRAHVQVGLPQHYMPLAMQIVRAELTDRLRASSVADVEKKLASLHKLLSIDLTIMLSSYQESFAYKMREFERKAVEGKLARAEHLAETGQLAASLAHEIKNPLAGISGAIQIIGKSLPADSPFKSIVRDILSQISRVDATVKDLLQYARPPAPTRKLVNLGVLASRIVGIMQGEPSIRDVPIRLNVSDTLIQVDEAQLEQLLMNLVLNAAHASKKNSPIDIESRENADGLALIVKDHGSGMAPDVLERALEPFYTTKTKGTGLGLAICRRIAESHGGTIHIESEAGRGATVIVELPRNGEVC